MSENLNVSCERRVMLKLFVVLFVVLESRDCLIVPSCRQRGALYIFCREPLM